MLVSLRTLHSTRSHRRPFRTAVGVQSRKRMRASRRAYSTSNYSRIGSTWESFFNRAHRVVVTVPATTSNLGPGFDSFGLALDIQNRVVVTRADEFSIAVHGMGAEIGGLVPQDESNSVVQMCKKAMAVLGKEMPPLRFECHNAVPPQRGLGSSSSAFVAGLAAGFALSGKETYAPHSKKRILQLAAGESHPSQAADWIRW